MMQFNPNLQALIGSGMNPDMDIRAEPPGEFSPVQDDGGQSRDDGNGGNNDSPGNGNGDDPSSSNDQQGYRMTNIANIAAILFGVYLLYQVYKGIQG